MKRPGFKSDKRMLEDAICLAADRLQGVRDRSGDPYLLHCLRVMFKQTTYRAMVVGVLYGILEETAITAEDLTDRGYPMEVVRELLALTSIPGESPQETAIRTGTYPIARQIKIDALEENLDLSRVKKIRPEDTRRFDEYRKIQTYLRSLS